MSKAASKAPGPTATSPLLKGKRDRYFACKFHKISVAAGRQRVKMIPHSNVIIEPKRGQVKLGQHSGRGLTLED